jgi:hypothetical protein
MLGILRARVIVCALDTVDLWVICVRAWHGVYAGRGVCACKTGSCTWRGETAAAPTPASLLRLAALFAGRRSRVPFYACTGRHAVEGGDGAATTEALRAAGVTIVLDTCVVVTPIMADGTGLVMTNSGKFAHYMKPNTGRDVAFGTLSDCVESAVSGHVARDPEIWA